MTYDRFARGPFDPDLSDRLTARRLQLEALLTQDGFSLQASGNHSTTTQTDLEYNYSNPDGRTAQIKFKLQTTQVLLTMRSPF